MNLRIALILHALLLVAVSLGQSPDADKANALFNEGKYQEALPLFQKLAEQESAGATVWMRLAFCQISTDRNRDAVASYEKAIAKGAPEGYVRYNIACAYSKLGEKEKALDAIERACDLGFGRAHMLRSDKDFDPIRTEDRFKKLLDRMANPTKGLKGAEAMDLWIGEWNVFANGQPAGENSIRYVLDRFAIEEKWTSRTGGKGQSLFTFDRSKGEWRQLWIDDRGWIVEKTGVPIENGILFEGWSYNAGGGKQRARTTLTKNPDGSVRQLIELESPDGKWTSAFDGRYVRKPLADG